MKIFIPTYGRSERQNTFKNLPKEIQKRVTLVVQHRERDLYPGYKIEVLPPKVQTIAPTREYIAKVLVNKRDKFVMLDDDLRFDHRRMDEKGKFYVATDKQVIKLFDKIEKSLDDYAHVGVLAREGGNRVLKSTVECARMMRVLAFRAEVLWKEDIKFYRGPKYITFSMEDFDVILQLLRKGYPNLVLCEWVNGQGSSNASGGCSHFRTIQVHNENAQMLVDLHKPFVKLVEKTTKTAWGVGTVRKDVAVQWKKAYESSQNAN